MPIALALLIISQSGSEPPTTPRTAEEVAEEILNAHSGQPFLEDMRLAPPVFEWPANLPDSFAYELESGENGTAFPAPVDTALKLYSMYCDYIPDECQRRLDAAYRQLDGLREETEGVLGYMPPDVIEGWQTWEVVLLIGGAVTLASALAFGGGYAAGVLHD